MKEENPSKVIRWEDNSLESFYGTLDEAEKHAEGHEKSEHMSFVVI